MPRCTSKYLARVSDWLEVWEKTLKFGVGIQHDDDYDDDDHHHQFDRIQLFADASGYLRDRPSCFSASFAILFLFFFMMHSPVHGSMPISDKDLMLYLTLAEG